RRLFTTLQQSFVNLRRGKLGLVPPPIDDIETYWSATEKTGVEQALACAVVGDSATVKRGIDEFIARHRPDEIMLTANVFDHAARLRSFGIAASLFDLPRTQTGDPTERLAQVAR
ncbi:MAG: LLM class flavin-dependent oxidoreductase, partial [Dokdonella sp.]